MMCITVYYMEEEGRDNPPNAVTAVPVLNARCHFYMKLL